jgi:secondary thiamine-phosphate synthase enzyme
MMRRFQIRTSRREELVDITARVQAEVEVMGLQDGAVLVMAPHTTAAITINENADPDVVTDLLAGLARIAPRDAGWRHSEGNSDGHLKSSLVGASELVVVADGRVQLGTWQGVYFCEFDGPRTRQVWVQGLAD